MKSHKSLPTTFFDSQKVTEARQKVQKSWEVENFWSWYTLRRISIFISLWISQETKIAPNTITVVGIFFGVLTGVSFLIGTRFSILLGVILYQLTFLCDCVDGEVARLKNMTSTEGVWLDDGLRYSLFFSFVVAVTRISSMISIDVGLVVMSIMILSVLSIIWASAGTSLTPELNMHKQIGTIRKKSKFRDGTIFLFGTEPGFYFGIFILYISNFYNSRVLVYAWTFLHVVSFVVKALFRTSKVLNSLCVKK